MNLPRGKPLKQGIDLATVNFKSLVKEIKSKNITGYLAIALKGNGGIEEGTIIFDNGKIVGCAYEYYKHEKTFMGKEAFPRVLNAIAAKQGVIDVYTLELEQVHLIFVVNEGMIFTPEENAIEKIKVESFSPLFEEELKNTAQKKTKEDVLSKYKMGEIGVTTKKEDVFAKISKNIEKDATQK
ncbi:DUF2226 domain-containing protein [Candidatus Micrarchaeota archaeon]|nr:DUF2226 domain-containing protein [Candidatus Micrarchaeota archaeon]